MSKVIILILGMMIVTYLFLFYQQDGVLLFQ